MRGLVVERRSGAAAAVIVQEAAERHAALIVMCPQIRTDSGSRALGSVAAAVLRAAPCPVVLVPPARGRKRWALRRLLVPHDGTPTSAATIGPATDLASMAAAELVVLHVATPGSGAAHRARDIGLPALCRPAPARVAGMGAGVSRLGCVLLGV